MGQYAPVAPPSILRRLATTGNLGTYHLLLAHDVAKNPKSYIDALYMHVAACSKMTIIMDNSVIELGYPVNKNIMMLARKAFPNSIIVLPDVIGNSSATLKLADAYVATVRNDPLLGPPYMAVPQGNNLKQFIDCARAQLQTSYRPSWWGIPRHAVSKLGTRHTLIYMLNNLDPSMKIHLLGFSDDIMDDITCTRRIEVSGIDSAVPIRLGMLHRVLELDPELPIPPRGEFWMQAQNLFSDQQMYQINANIRRFNQWIHAKTVHSAA